MPQGANTNTNKTNGIEPNQEIEKNFTNLKFPNPFKKKHPTQEKPRI